MWPAIIQAGAKLGGDIFNAISTNKVSKYNAQLEADTNRWITEQNIKSARDLTTMQNEYNTEMWNKQNEYNDPSHQAALYEKAGFHKQAVLGQFSSGAASAQGAAGVMPDFSAGNGDAKKSAFVLPELGKYVEDFINILDKIEEHKRNKIITNQEASRDRILAAEADNAIDWFNFRTGRAEQDFHLHGGYITQAQADKLASLFHKNQQHKHDLLGSQSDLAKAHYTTYSKHGEDMFKAQLDNLNGKNWLFENVEKPYQKTFGVPMQVFNSFSTAIGKALSTFLKLPVK